MILGNKKVAEEVQRKWVNCDSCGVDSNLTAQEKTDGVCPVCNKPLKDMAAFWGRIEQDERESGRLKDHVPQGWGRLENFETKYPRREDIESLTDVANALDSVGLVAQADEIDKMIVALADNSWPTNTYNEQGQQMVSKYSPTEQEVGVISPRMKMKPMKIGPSPKVQKYIADLKLLRKELGLPERPVGTKNLFDRALSDLLKKHYPGVWKPRTGQKPADILAGVKQRKDSAYMAGKKMDRPRGEPVGTSVPVPPMPTTNTPNVNLGPKFEMPR